MSQRILRLVLPCALAASVLPAVASPAGAAAARPCVVGKWKLTGFTARNLGYVEYTAVSKGMKGVRLTVAKSSLSYDFTRSKKAVTTGTDSGKPIDEWTKYDRRLKVGATFRGGAKGTLALKARTASGDATFTHSQAPSRHRSLPARIRKKQWDMVVLKRASYTCTAETLTFRTSQSWYHGEHQFHATLRYTRR
ncbi:hypothetical protein [Actinocorallia populi]|uniref:hypothetical protein n=1 Tax=Actinocorallia populi TaxID=2079200 RepID=UPI000D086EDD|nr:hypothetical protein [Actinocorallia populi]